MGYIIVAMAVTHHATKPETSKDILHGRQRMQRELDERRWRFNKATRSRANLRVDGSRDANCQLRQAVEFGWHEKAVSDHRCFLLRHLEFFCWRSNAALESLLRAFDLQWRR